MSLRWNAERKKVLNRSARKKKTKNKQKNLKGKQKYHKANRDTLKETNEEDTSKRTN